MLVLFYGAGISFILLVGRPIPLSWIRNLSAFFIFYFNYVMSLKNEEKSS